MIHRASLFIFVWGALVLAGGGEEGRVRWFLPGSAHGGRFRFSSRCAFLAQRNALGVPASLFAEPSALRLALGSWTFGGGELRCLLPS
ncbi:MAG: hypothetical protein LBT22_02355 [Peptococcaceae bacterium]|nr:hypothetical protein [Peptococcaceae bacterium]